MITFNPFAHMTVLSNVFTAGVTRSIVGVYDDGVRAAVYANKQSGTSAPNAQGALPSEFWISARAANADTWDSTMDLWCLFGTVWSDGEARALEENPWQIFRPRRAITYSLPAGGTTYNDSVTETAAAIDTVNSVATLPSGVVESASGVDSVAATRVGAGVISESASAADSVNAGAGVYAVSVSESASAADAIVSSAVLVGGLAEAGAATDTVNGTCVFTRAIAEAASAADAVATGANIYAVSVNESASSADSVSALAVLTGGVSEAGAAADAVMAQLVAVSTIVETGVAVDVLAASGGTVISNIFRAAVNDALAFRCVASDAELAA